ncbi:MAG: SDR family oxidoreductase [Myxococcaceae bacterium]|nr:SDR family oxidoreductase [Myxococcaceae bacterium]
MSETSLSTSAAKRALITGASAGIGRELARIFAADGWSLVLVARRAELLAELAAELKAKHGTDATVIAADLGTRAGVDTVIRTVQERGLDLDALVNNAGYGLAGPFAELDAEKQLGMIDLNVTALTALTRAFLPGMIARRHGAVLNVASTAGMQPGPLMAVYYATKAYVVSFSEALTEEVRGTGVTVTALCPGYTETEFAARAAEHHRPRLFSGPMGKGDAREVALVGYRAMKKGTRLVIPGGMNKLAAWSVPFTPRGVLLKIVRRMNESA